MLSMGRFCRAVEIAACSMSLGFSSAKSRGRVVQHVLSLSHTMLSMLQFRRAVEIATFGLSSEV